MDSLGFGLTWLEDKGHHREHNDDQKHKEHQRTSEVTYVFISRGSCTRPKQYFDALEVNNMRGGISKTLAIRKIQFKDKILRSYI